MTDVCVRGVCVYTLWLRRNIRIEGHTILGLVSSVPFRIQTCHRSPLGLAELGEAVSGN